MSEVRHALMGDVVINLDTIATQINDGYTADKERMTKMINRMLAFLNEFVKLPEPKETHELGEQDYCLGDTYQVECPECGRTLDNGGDWVPGIFEEFDCMCGKHFTFAELNGNFLVSATKVYWNGEDFVRCFPSPGEDGVPFMEFLKDKDLHYEEEYVGGRLLENDK